jgi:hypothetical protein
MSGASAAAIAAYRSKKKDSVNQPKAKMTTKQKAVVITVFAAAAIASGFIAAN